MLEEVLFFARSWSNNFGSASTGGLSRVENTDQECFKWPVLCTNLQSAVNKSSSDQEYFA